MHGDVYRLVGGLAAYTLLVANIINVLRFQLYLPLTDVSVFITAFVTALAAMMIERRLTRGWPVARYYKLYWAIVAAVIGIAAAVAFLCCPVICAAFTCSCGVSTCSVDYYAVYTSCDCECFSC